MQYLGIFFALGALFAWAFGDFFIQRSTRRVGTIKALFFIASAGAIGFLPFVWNDIGQLLEGKNLLWLALAASVTFFAAVFDFDALHDGKLAVVEPILGLELPIVVLLAILVCGERLSVVQTIAIAAIFVGLLFAVTAKKIKWHKRIILEKGFVYAGIGAVGMGLTNFLYAYWSQQASPLIVVWSIHTVLACVCLVVMMRRGVIHELAGDLRRHYRILVPMAIFDNLAWLAYSLACTHISIAVSNAISEIYIALALILGVVVNKEKLRKHQYFGAILAITALVVLSYTTPEL